MTAVQGCARCSARSAGGECLKVQVESKGKDDGSGGVWLSETSTASGVGSSDAGNLVSRFPSLGLSFSICKWGVG